MTKEALKLALDYIVATNKSSEFWLVPHSNLNKAVTAIKEALAQPEQEPLTDKQILADETLRYYFGQNGGAGPVSKQGRKVVDAIEAAHGIKEKNT